jgi:methionyl-tRNA formyltransferase
VVNPLRVAFAGTPPFAVAALNGIVDAGHELVLVLTQPDRPQGRGMRVASSAVKAEALAHGLTVLTPATLKDEAAQASLAGFAVDLLVVAAYGLILPDHVLAWPTHGCINIHASLLPRWRGAAPIQRALLAGDCETGISIMQMDAGLDTGPIISMAAVQIGERETGGTLHDKLAAVGSRAIVDALDRLRREGRLVATPQSRVGATYAAKIARSDAQIDWSADAYALDRQVRALNPAPGAATVIAGVPTKIWAAEPVRGDFGSAGALVRADAHGIVVACGDGALVVRELQRAGGKKMSAGAFAAGNLLRPRAPLGHAHH